MLKGTLRLFRVEGIPVDIHWTWLFVFVLVFWSLATNLFPATYPGRASKSSAGAWPVAARMAPTLRSTTTGSSGSCPPAQRRAPRPRLGHGRRCDAGR